MENNSLAEKLIREHMKKDRVNNDHNLWQAFSFYLFNNHFGWRSELHYLRDSLRELIKLIAQQDVIEIANIKEISLDEATEHLLRIGGFIEELKRSWEDKMELYCLINASGGQG